MRMRGGGPRPSPTLTAHAPLNSTDAIVAVLNLGMEFECEYILHVQNSVQYYELNIN